MNIEEYLFVLDGSPELLAEIAQAAMRQTVKAAALWLQVVWLSVQMVLKTMFILWPYIYPHLKRHATSGSKGSWTILKRASIFLWSLDPLTWFMIICVIALVLTLRIAKRAKVDQKIIRKYSALKQSLHGSFKAIQAMIRSKSQIAGWIFPHLLFIAMTVCTMLSFGEHFTVISRSWLFPVGAVVYPLVKVVYTGADVGTESIRESVFWLRYFVALALLILIEELPLLRKIPIFSELRCIYAFWLMFPWCQGGRVMCSIISNFNQKKYLIDSPLLSFIVGRTRMVASIVLPFMGLSPAMMQALEGGLLQLSTVPLGLSTPYYANILLGVVYPMFASLSVLKDALDQHVIVTEEQRELVVFWLRYFITFRLVDQFVALDLPGILRWIPFLGWVWKLCRLLLLLWLQLPGLRGSDTIYGFLKNPNSFWPWLWKRVILLARGLGLCFNLLSKRFSTQRVASSSKRSAERSSQQSSKMASQAARELKNAKNE